MDGASVETLASIYLCDEMSVFPKRMQSLSGEAEGKNISN